MLQEKLKAGESFAFTRFSDGEMNIMKNQHLILDNKSTRIDGETAGIKYDSIDHKEFDPEKHAFVRDKLMSAYKFDKDNYFVGLSCPCCVGHQNNDWMKKQRGTDDKHLTWANLLVNSNYPIFLEHMVPLLKEREVVFVCNKKSTFNELPFEIKKDFRIGKNAMVNDLHLSEEIGSWIKQDKIKDHVFLFSASTLSNLLIYELFRDFPNNTYIDVGTTLHPLMSMPLQRNYLKGYWLNSGNTEIRKYCTW